MANDTVREIAIDLAKWREVSDRMRRFFMTPAHLEQTKNARAAYQHPMCKLTPELINRALSEYPSHQTSSENRWREVLPSVDAREYPVLKAMCTEMFWGVAVSLAEEARREKGRSEETASQELAQIYSFLSKDTIRSLWNRAAWVASR